MSQLSHDDWRNVAARVSNWGRWGTADELGALNLITAEKTHQASSCIRVGEVIPLSIPVSGDGPMGIYGSRRNPLHVMTEVGLDVDCLATVSAWSQAEASGISSLLGSGLARFTDDYLMLHLQSGTHWDSLAHCYYENYLYNGHAATTVTSLGARRNSIERVAQAGHVVTRGVLLDIARYRAVPWLPLDAVVLPSELEAVSEAQGVEIQPGDAILIRTGMWTFLRETKDLGAWSEAVPGLSWTCAEWFRDRDVAAVAADNSTLEAHNERTFRLGESGPEGEMPYLFHMLAIRDIGMTLGELWDLDRLGAACVADKRYTFMLVAQPLPVSGGVGAPVCPVALR